MNFLEHFRETMDFMGVKSKDLCAAINRSPKHISQIRQGKANVGVKDFEIMIIVCDRLCPGFKQEFKKRCLEKSEDLEDIIDRLDADGVAKTLVMLSDRLGKLRAGKIPIAK